MKALFAVGLYRFRKILDPDDGMVIAPAPQARGPRFESRREHSSFSVKSLNFVPVASGFLWNGTGGNSKQFIYISIFVRFCQNILQKLILSVNNDSVLLAGDVMLCFHLWCVKSDLSMVIKYNVRAYIAWD